MSYVLRWLISLAGLVLLFSDLWVAAGTSWMAGEAQEQLRDRFDDSAVRSLTKVHATGDASAPPPVEFLDLPRPERGAPVALLRIPALDLETVVVEGSKFEQLRMGVGHDQRTPLPGEGGKTVIVGHPTLFGAPFRHIGLLDRGHRVRLDTRWGEFTYAVLKTTSADPDGQSPVDPAASPGLTLIAWEPSLGDAARLAVRAVLVSGPSDLPVFAAPAPQEAPLAETPPELPPGSLPRLGAVRLSRGPDRPVPRDVVTYPEPAPVEPAPEEDTGEAPPPVGTPAPDAGPSGGGVGSGHGSGSPEQAESPSPEPVTDPPEERPPPEPSPEPNPVDRSKPACRDGLDNDGDGLIDYRALDGSRQDLNCNGANDDDE